MTGFRRFAIFPHWTVCIVEDWETSTASRRGYLIEIEVSKAEKSSNLVALVAAVLGYTHFDLRLPQHTGQPVAQ